MVNPLYKKGDVVQYSELYTGVVKNLVDDPSMIVLECKLIPYQIGNHYYKYKVLRGDLQFEIAEGYISLV